MSNYIQNGAFLGTLLRQVSANSGKGKGVFVPLEGEMGKYQFPTYGGVIANPFPGTAKLFAGDLAELRTDENGLNGKYYILKTFEVADAVSASTTVYIKRDGFRHVPFVGDVLMIAPSVIGGKGTAVTVTAVSATNATISAVSTPVWQLTVSSSMTIAKGDILVEAEEAGSNKAMLVKAINSVCPSDYDMVYEPSTTFGNVDDSDFDKARYFVAFALGGIMYTKKMSPLPQCVLDLNKSNVNGWFEASYKNMTAFAKAESVGDNTLGISADYTSTAVTSSTPGKVGDIKTNGSNIYVCTAVDGTTYTWKKAALSSL